MCMCWMIADRCRLKWARQQSSPAAPHRRGEPLSTPEPVLLSQQAAMCLGGLPGALVARRDVEMRRRVGEDVNLITVGVWPIHARRRDRVGLSLTRGCCRTAPRWSQVGETTGDRGPSRCRYNTTEDSTAVARC